MTTLVTIPGIMSDARTWSTVAEAVSLEEATVHVADISRDATIEDMAARSLAETDGELIVLAHSMGGRVALEMGHQAPDREANSVVKPIHPKAMSIILTEPEEIELWLTADWRDAKALQRPFPAEAMTLLPVEQTEAGQQATLF
jgi:pimeloyl-ACP methyl ester carboxylesterase